MASTPKKFAVVNDALRLTGNNPAVEADLTAAPDDQTEEWAFASPAYDNELKILLERHDWKFAKATEALEQADDDDNPSNRFGKAYEWPYSALWLKTVEPPGGGEIDYEIIGKMICMDYDGEDDDAPVATFIQVPLLTSDMSNLFWSVLTGKVEVAVIRGFNKDTAEARARDREIEALLLPIVRNRTDQQQPARRAFRSTMIERRRAGR